MNAKKWLAILLLWPCMGSAQQVSEKNKEMVFVAAFDYYFLHEFCATSDPMLSADSLEQKMQEDVRQVLQLNKQKADIFVDDFISSYNEFVSDNDEYGQAISYRVEQFNAINNEAKQDSCRSMKQDRSRQFQEALKQLKSEL
ncbi:MAG: hypothetical protein GX040_07095 [Alcaligenaceae bacterium]|nr:hypothetical protein [Alcaligenaceae bacterium]